MLGIYFIFALAASYSLCISGQISPECVERQHQECDQSLLPQEIPRTVDQLRDNCRDVQELAGCSLKVYDSCVEDSDSLSHYRQIADYVRDICREDSEIFQVFSSNLECIASNSANIYISCKKFEHSEATMELIRNMRQYANNSQIQTGRPDYMCMDALYGVHCPSAKASISCGFEVGTVVKDMLSHTTLSEEICSPEFVTEVTPMLEAVQLAIIQDENLKVLAEEEEETSSKECTRSAC